MIERTGAEMKSKIVRAPFGRLPGLRLLPLALLLAAGCGRDSGGSGSGEASASSVGGEWNPASLASVAGTPAAPVRTAIQRRMAASQPKPLDEDQWAHAKRLYARYGQGPLWFDKNGLISDRTAALMKALINSHQDALRIDRYPVGELATALGAVKDAKAPTAQQIADADVLLTASYVALGEDLLTGQVEPKSVSKDWHIDPQEEQVDSALTRALRESPLDAAIAKMRPQDDDYAALQKELLRYRQIAARGDWPRVPEGKALKPGQSDSAARLDALRQRLRMEGILADSASRGAKYDASLAGAVAEFQGRHGIESDSTLGSATVASLNTPPAFRLGQIAANLERYRWLPRSFGSRYILVNVPAFRLEAYDQGKKALEMKVIVGEEFEGKVTPVFSDSMEYAVFRPYWLVTPDIAEKEIFPKMSADPGYLAAENLETYQEQGQTRVRQKPGPKNSLGLVKFMFPNDYNIYLHDTPHGELFEKDVRAFSHGCIRVEHPDQLAQWVFGWSEQQVQQAMNGPDDHRVSLPRKIPVFIAYFTTYTRGGKLYYGNDLYKRDDDLIHAVAAGALPDPRSLQNLNALRRFVAD
jgi:murein L,D-transpeptidase YcbB/YkuD